MMVRRFIRWMLAAGLCSLLACHNSGGCGGTYDYPRTDPDGLPTPKSTRLRITQHGLDTVASAFPSLLASACAANPADGSAACALDPVNPANVRLYLSTTAAPLDYDMTLSQGQVRPNSFLTLDDQSLHGNVHISLVDVIGSGDGLQVTLGCDAANFASCTDASKFVNASIDMTIYTSGLLGWGASSCFVQDDLPPAPGVTIQSLRFTIYPHVDLGVDGKPYLVVNNADVVVQRMEVALSVQTGKACWETAVCGTVCGPGDCSLCTAGSVLTDYIIKPLVESETVSKYIATLVARQILRNFAKNALEVVGAIDEPQLLSFANPGAEPTGYLIDANTDSPEVTGAAVEAGMNIDFDAGFIARHSPCVPIVAAPSWALPATPDPGATVMAPDPTTGALRAEPFDLALLVGDAVPGRALFELFDGGGFCFNLAAETIQRVSGGRFTPSVGGLSVVAPGLATLAPAEAPVMLAIVPQLPPLVSFGTGEGEGEARDSNLKLAWPQFTLELLPFVDEEYVRALAITCDLEIGLSLVPTPRGDLQIMIDKLTLTDLVASYNEVPVQFDAQGLGDVISLFLPTFVTGRPFDVQLTAATFGFPFMPKVRKVTSLGAQERFLGLFMRFCSADDLTNPANPLCYESPTGSGKGPRPGRLSVAVVDGPGGALGAGVARVRAFSDLGTAAELELAYRVDGLGPFYSFRGADPDGLFTLTHPALAIPGWHALETIARPRSRPGAWSEPASLDLLADLLPPTVTAERVGERVEVHAADDFTSESRLQIRATVNGSAGERVERLASGASFSVARDEAVSVVAEDDAGNVSAPVILPAKGGAAIAVREPGGAEAGGSDCTATPPSPLVGLVILLGAWRRQARQTSPHRR
jgi:hypothetical protein